MKHRLSFRSRVLGFLLGGAVGDALGSPVEFLSIDQIKQRFGPEGVTGYPARSRPAIFTDDTQMTLWTAEGLIRARQRRRDRRDEEWDPVRAINSSYLRWFLTQESGVSPAGPIKEAEPLRSGWLIDEPGLWVRAGGTPVCPLSAWEGWALVKTRSTIRRDAGE